MYSCLDVVRKYCALKISENLLRFMCQLSVTRLVKKTFKGCVGIHHRNFCILGRGVDVSPSRLACNVVVGSVIPFPSHPPQRGKIRVHLPALTHHLISTHVRKRPQWKTELRSKNSQCQTID